MSLNFFNSSVFSQLLAFNDSNVVEWARNVFIKIKQDGILPKYIIREKIDDRVDIFSLSNDEFLIDRTGEDDDFTFEVYCKDSSAALELSRVVNIGTSHVIEFEIKGVTTEDVYIMHGGNGSNIYILGTTISYTTSLEFLEFYPIDISSLSEIKIVRDNLSVSMFVNGVLIDTILLSNNAEFTFREFLGSTSTTLKIANIKITRGDKILHWWKLNSVYDEGYGDKDFYTLWDSIVYIFALAYGQIRKFLHIFDNVSLIKKFLNTFDIKYNNSISDSDLSSIINDWTRSLQERGTTKQILKKDIRKGICLNLPNPSIGYTNLATSINLGTVYDISFDWKYAINYLGNTLNGGIIKGVNSAGTPPTLNYIINIIWTGTAPQMNFYPKLSGELFSKVFTVSSELYSIRIIRNNVDVFIYINNTLEYTGVGVLSSGIADVIEQDTTFNRGTLIRGVCGKIANLKVKTPSTDILIPFNTPSYKVEDNDNNYSFSYMYSVLGGSFNIYDLDKLFVSDDTIENNVKYSIVDGELLRMVGGDMHGFLFPLCAPTDLGWTVDSSSPQSSQSYPIQQMNLLPAINEISDLAIQYGKGGNSSVDNISIVTEGGVRKIKIMPQSGLVGDLDYYGVSIGLPTITGYNFQYTPEEWARPISAALDYEISFRMRCENDGIETFEFAVILYDENYNIISPISARDGVSTSKFVTLSTTKTIDKYLNKEIWVRGVLYNSSKTINEDITSLNLNFSSLVANNLIMPYNTKYAYPTILVRNNTTEVNPVYIWDVQLRPIDVTIDKGRMGDGNIILPFINNDSGMSDDAISNIVDRQFTPYNTLSRIKFLDNPIFVNQSVKLGYLYNTYAINGTSGDFMPLDMEDEGWRVPTEVDFNNLVAYIDGNGGDLKSTSLIYWNSPNTGATNRFGFNAKAGGYRDDLGEFTQIMQNNLIKSSDNSALLLSFNSSVATVNFSSNEGGGVRVVRDITETELGSPDGYIDSVRYIGCDGKEYGCCKIGNQIWTNSNLKETLYRDLSPIPVIVSDSSWSTDALGARCSYNNIESNA